eukprot:c21957_g1_i2 orf=732-992(+)
MQVRCYISLKQHNLILGGRIRDANPSPKQNLSENSDILEHQITFQSTRISWAPDQKLCIWLLSLLPSHTPLHFWPQPLPSSPLPAC